MHSNWWAAFQRRPAGASGGRRRRAAEWCMPAMCALANDMSDDAGLTDRDGRPASAPLGAALAAVGRQAPRTGLRSTKRALDGLEKYLNVDLLRTGAGGPAGPSTARCRDGALPRPFRTQDRLRKHVCVPFPLCHLLPQPAAGATRSCGVAAPPALAVGFAALKPTCTVRWQLLLGRRERQRQARHLAVGGSCRSRAPASSTVWHNMADSL